MDNPLTPNKIQRLIHLAEDKSFNMPRRLLLSDEDLKRLASHPASSDKSTTNTSSGILDLERVEGFGESEIGNLSLSKSSAFNPGEMTGRSTGTEEICNKTRDISVKKPELGRHSIALDSLAIEMDKQTTEIHNLMRHSIASNYSFHSKRDLTADEASFQVKQAVLPIPLSQHTNFIDSLSINTSKNSVGAYFKKRCPESIQKVLGNTDSPDRSGIPSFCEGVSASSQLEPLGHSTNVYKMDQTLDSIPVKQSRNPNANMSERNVMNNLNNTKYYEKKPDYEITKTDNQISSGKLEKQDNVKVQDTQKHLLMTSTKSTISGVIPKPLNSSSKPMDIMLRNLHSSYRVATEDTESDEYSLSISKIADYLTGKQSNSPMSITEILQCNQAKGNKKTPLTELQMNSQDYKPSRARGALQITHLKDSKSMAASSSAGSIATVVSTDKLNRNDNIPAVYVTDHPFGSNDNPNIEMEAKVASRSSRSKSPSSKSQSTLTTVQENYASFKSNESPLQDSKGGEANRSHVPSPNTEYKELDKSVNWQDVLQHRHLEKEALAKEQWVDIATTVASGYVGVSCPVTITIANLTDSWLTAKLQFDDYSKDNKDLAIELPRTPQLLSPGKSEHLTLHITSNTEVSTALPFSVLLRDASIDGDMEQKCNVPIDIKMPMIQAMSSYGVNKVNFPSILEMTSFTKCFVLISDCTADLQLDLSVVEGESMFAIKNVSEIKKSDINKVLMEGSMEETQNRAKSKPINKQLCRLSGGNAIKVTITFNAPKLADLKLTDALTTFNGVLSVNLYGICTTLRNIDLIASVGSAKLVVQMTGDKLQLTNEPTTLTLCNTGSIQGMWSIKINMSNPNKIPFKISPLKFDIQPGATKTLTLSYTGPEDCLTEAALAFEDVATGYKTRIDISGGTEKPKTFPVKTNYNVMSWIRAGRKELSLKNVLNKKVHIRCHIAGDGFTIDLPGMETRGTYVIQLGPTECKTLPILFNANSCTPYSATLHLVYDRNSEFSRSVRLYGCAGGAPLRWHGLVTYGDTALVRAPTRQDLSLELYNRAATAAFVLARLHFNLQFMSLAESSRLIGGRCIVAGRAKHSMLLKLDWQRVERRARDAGGSNLATVTLLTGADITRRRILKVIRNESNGELDTSLLPEHLRELAGPFEGEDSIMDNQLAHFKETQTSLSELIGGLREMTAQIDLPQDFAEEYTILISDDTVLEHHTLCD